MASVTKNPAAPGAPISPDSQMPDEAAGHALLDERHVYHLIGTPRDQQAAHIYLPPGLGSTRTLQYRAAVLTLAADGETSGAGR